MRVDQRTTISHVFLTTASSLALGGALLGCSGDSAANASASASDNPLNSVGGSTGSAGSAGTGSGTAGTNSAGQATVDDTTGGFEISNTAVEVPPDPTCIQEGVEIETLTPTVELLVDRSGSMNADFGVQDRWNTIRDVLVNPTNGFVKQMEAKVRFGLTLYTGYVTDTDTAATCPNLIEQAIGLNNHMPIYTTFMANEIGGSTPSAESIAAATSKLEVFTEVGPKVLVFATDGDPDTCIDPDSNGEIGPRMGSEAAVQAAWDKGIATYVISVGADVDQTHLQDLAVIGAGGDPTAHFYPALDSAGLIDAFGQILRGVVSCDFELNGTVTPQNAERGTVAIDQTPLVYNDPNGWSLVGESTVRLNGTACDNVKLSVSFVDIKFPCGSVTIF